MIDLIVFKVANNSYALDIGNIKRIIQDVELTTIPNNNEFIDGIMNYEDGILKVLNLRKLVGVKSYVEELYDMFSKIKVVHSEWVDELSNSISGCYEFTKTTNPHECELGKWLDSFNSYDDFILDVLKDLRENHNQLHRLGKDVISICEEDNDRAREIFDTQIKIFYTNTIDYIDTFMSQLPKIAYSLQKMIIYEDEQGLFAIRIDSIEDIAHIQESDIKYFDNQREENDLLEIGGVLDLNSNLINIINTIQLPHE